MRFPVPPRASKIRLRLPVRSAKHSNVIAASVKVSGRSWPRRVPLLRRQAAGPSLIDGCHHDRLPDRTAAPGKIRALDALAITLTATTGGRSSWPVSVVWGVLGCSTNNRRDRDCSPRGRRAPAVAGSTRPRRSPPVSGRPPAQSGDQMLIAALPNATLNRSHQITTDVKPVRSDSAGMG